MVKLIVDMLKEGTIRPSTSPFSSLVLLGLKCHFYLRSFCIRSIDYLGHIITGQGVQVDSSKLQAILGWSTPTFLTTLQAFLGPIGFYMHFVHHYATIASPLTDLLKYMSLL
ncbi:putative mitochondrial protein, partial [Mucuna pruriens]